MDCSKLNFLKKSRTIHLCFAITYFASGIIINMIQWILYISLRPFNKRLYRKINWYLNFSIFSQLVFLGDWWSGSEVVHYIDREEYDKYYGKEHAYCVMNHTYEIDWLIGWMICDRIDLLGNCKAYAKKAIQYMPILGWSWRASDFVFLERNFQKDKENIHKQIGELVENPDPIWLLLFPEGTRFTPKKHEAALQFAREHNLSELKHHLVPRTKGFIASLPAMVGKMPAIYDILVAFNEHDAVAPTIRNLLLGKPVTCHIYMKRIPFEDVPKTNAEQETFLRDMFDRKDKMKDSFLKTGDFFKLSGIPRVEPFTIKPHKSSIYNTLFWVITILCPIAYQLLNLLFSGQLFYFCLGAGIIVILSVLMNKTIGMSEINKGSSYGSTVPHKTD